MLNLLSKFFSIKGKPPAITIVPAERISTVALNYATISPGFSSKTGYGISKSCFKHSEIPTFVVYLLNKTHKILRFRLQNFSSKSKATDTFRLIHKRKLFHALSSANKTSQLLF